MNISRRIASIKFRTTCDFLGRLSKQQSRATILRGGKAAIAKRFRRQILEGIVASGFVVIGSMTPVWATNFYVINDDSDGPGSFQQAILDVNAAGAGNHSILFSISSSEVDLDDNLPVIWGTNQTITIEGNDNTIQAGSNKIFHVAGGNVTIRNLVLDHADARGGSGGDGYSGGGGGAGAGGALFVGTGANVTMENISFTDNEASGGNGGWGDAQELAGGGGGGYGGRGGRVLFDGTGGGGGGGFAGQGGNVGSFIDTATGGGGGGGVTGEGGESQGYGGGGGGGEGDGSAAASGTEGGTGDGGAAGGDNGSAGAPGEPGGGGGGGTIVINESGGAGGAGAVNGGGGGGGGADLGGFGGAGGNGGDYGGGGGAGGGSTTPNFENGGGTGGDGGKFGGGGGGGAGTIIPGAGGNGGKFGGGGGAPVGGAAGEAGLYGGDGATSGNGGNGGDGLGGAIFVEDGGTLTILDSTIVGSDASGGSGGFAFGGGSAGQNGNAYGAGVYMETTNTSTFSVSTGNTITYQDRMDGAGGITKVDDGTMIIVNSHGYTGTTYANDGRLLINGTIASETIVNSGGLLGGTGTIDNDVTNNGTMAPGNSIGTLHVTGTYTSNSGSDFEVEINDGGTTPGTNNDLLDVTGIATINGGTVRVVAAPGTYASSSVYTFLTANEVNGTFDGISDDIAFLEAVLGYTPTTAYFHFIFSYASEGQTPNEVSVGDYLDEISSGATGDVAYLLEELAVVPASEAPQALEQLGGAIYGSLGQVGVENTTIYLQTLSRRLRTNQYDGDGLMAEAACDQPAVLVCSTKEQPLIIRGQCCRPRWNTWATGFGLGGNAESDGNAAGLDYSMGGMLAGMETYSNSKLLGFYGGYLGNYVGTDANESAQVNGGTFGSYLVGRESNQYYIGAGGFEFDGYESRRRISFAGLTAEGETDGWKGYGYFERGATFGDQRLAIQPFGALQYIYVRQNGFQETGAPGANLAVPGINTHSFRSVLGSRIYGRGVSRGGRWIAPEARALWFHEFLDPRTDFTTEFAQAGGGNTFAINGLGLGRDFAMLGGGLNCDLGGGWSAYSDYDLMLNDQTTFHIGSGGVQYTW